MNAETECDYVIEFRKKFSENANQFDALMTEMLADSKRFIGYLNYLGIDPMDGSPTAEEIVAMRIQELQRNNEKLSSHLSCTQKELHGLKQNLLRLGHEQ